MASLFHMLAFAALVGAGDGAAARAPAVAGDYRFGEREPVTVRVAAAEDGKGLVGKVVAASRGWQRGLVGQTVLKLAPRDDGGYRGRCSAYHMGLSDDTTVWLEVTKAVAAASGDLRCTLKLPGGASVEVVYRRVADKAAPARGNDLAGAWRDADGLVIAYEARGSAYLGRIVALSEEARKQGFERGATVAVLKKTGEGVYQGTVEVRANGQKREEEATVTVRGDRLTSVRGKGEGGAGAQWAATRFGTRSAGGEGEPGSAPAVEPDPGELAGVWAAANGDVTRYVRTAKGYSGTVVKVSAAKKGLGFVVGEECVRLKRYAGGAYIGKVKVRSADGGTWWDDIEMTVRTNRLSFTRHVRGGGVQRGRALRAEVR